MIAEVIVGAIIVLETGILAYAGVRAHQETRAKKEKLHWRDLDYNLLLAMNELNVEFPTETSEEKELAKYLQFNTRAEHEHYKQQRAGGCLSDIVRESESFQTISQVRGPFTTLLSPGLGGLFGGHLGGLGGGVQRQLGQQVGMTLDEQHNAQYNAMQQGYADHGNVQSALSSLAQANKKRDLN